MTTMKGRTGPARAWRFLKRNPLYVAQWSAHKDTVEAMATPPFPMRIQTQSERSAASAWGLLAWEDPLDPDGPAAPFWAAAPTLRAESEPAETPFFSEVQQDPNARLSGLRLADGAVMLKLEEKDASVQMRFDDGASFDPAGGVDIGTKAGLDLRMRLRRVADLWPLAAATAKKTLRRFRTRGFCWPWMAISPARARARWASSSTARRRSRRTGIPTVRCAPVCAGASTGPGRPWRAATCAF